MRLIGWLVAFTILSSSLNGLAAAQAAPGDKNATVYVYRRDREGFLYSFVFSRKLPVWFAEEAGKIEDKRTIAELKKKRYFKLSLVPGTYTFDTKYFSGAATLTLAAGETRYLRYDHGVYCPSEDNNRPSWEKSNCEDSSPYIETVDESTGAADLLKLKPISKSDIKEPGIVIIPPNSGS